MFKSNSIIYDINILSKAISLILVIISLIALQQPTFLVAFGLITLIIAFPLKNTSVIAMIAILFAIAANFIEGILWLPKLILLLVYLLLVKKFTKTSELRYLLEVTLYKFQSKQITFKILNIIYFFKQLRKNINIFDRLRDEYGMAKDFFYIRFSFKKAWKKTRYEMKEFIMMNDLRFYNYSKERTYIEKITWERWDTKYLLFHILIFIVTFLLGR